MSEEHGPLIRIVRGQPTDDELAALIAVVAAKATAANGDTPARPRPASWSAYWRSVRAPLRPGRDGWRASALPRGGSPSLR